MWGPGETLELEGSWIPAFAGKARGRHWRLAGTLVLEVSSVPAFADDKGWEARSEGKAAGTMIFVWTSVVADAYNSPSKAP